MSHFSFLLMFKFYIDSLFLCYLKVGMAARAIQKKTKKTKKKPSLCFEADIFSHLKAPNNDC